MNKRIKRKWLKALRSGQYLQGEGQLRQKTLGGKNKFCCLGVLCNIHAQEHPNVAKHQLTPDAYMGHTASLPDVVVEWAGMGDGFGEFTTARGEDMTLAELNDGCGIPKPKTFKQIANYIEKYF